MVAQSAVVSLRSRLLENSLVENSLVENSLDRCAATRFLHFALAIDASAKRCKIEIIKKSKDY